MIAFLAAVENDELECGQPRNRSCQSARYGPLEMQNDRVRLAESIRLRIPKVACQAKTRKDGPHLIGLRTPRVLL
jgi:hypothetical protein